MTHIQRPRAHLYQTERPTFSMLGRVCFLGWRNSVDGARLAWVGFGLVFVSFLRTSLFFTHQSSWSICARASVLSFLLTEPPGPRGRDLGGPSFALLLSKGPGRPLRVLGSGVLEAMASSPAATAPEKSRASVCWTCSWPWTFLH
jgi:hypothetical protein